MSDTSPRLPSVAPLQAEETAGHRLSDKAGVTGPRAQVAAGRPCQRRVTRPQTQSQHRHYLLSGTERFPKRLRDGFC